MRLEACHFDDASSTRAEERLRTGRHVVGRVEVARAVVVVEGAHDGRPVRLAVVLAHRGAGLRAQRVDACEASSTRVEGALNAGDGQPPSLSADMTPTNLFPRT